MELETKVYQKENNLHVGRLLKDSLGDIYHSRFLARQLAIRDIKAQYRQSYFGIIWAFAGPLATAFIWIFLNSSGTVQITDTGVPYPVYAFTGTLIWSIITESINSPMASTNAAKSLLSKINFPKEALIVSGVYKLLFNSTVKILLLIVFVILYGVGIQWSLFLFPLAILGALLVGSTLGLLLTPLGMLYKDIGRMITFSLQFVMYVTPVVYAIPKGGLMKTIMEYNPLSYVILTARDFVVGMTPEYLPYFFITIVSCIPLLLIALVFYRISIPVLVERLSG